MAETVIPPDNILQNLVQVLEQLIDKDGFGQDAKLIALAAHGRSVIVVDVPLEFTDEPMADLWRIAQGCLRGEEGIDEMIAGVVDGTIGWVFVQEMNVNLTAPRVSRFLGSWEDDPDARLTRVVFGMDILGRVYHIVHQQGEDPQQLGTSKPVLSGTLPEALRALNIVVAERLPDSQRFLTALAEVDIITEDEMAIRAMNAAGKPMIYQKHKVPTSDADE